MKYCHFSVEDFLNDSYFIKWVKSPDKETNEFWLGFMISFPHKSTEVEEAKSFILQFSNSFDTVTVEEETEEWQKLKIKISDSDKRGISYRLWKWIKFTAVLIPVIIILLVIILILIA